VQITNPDPALVKSKTVEIFIFLLVDRRIRILEAQEPQKPAPEATNPSSNKNRQTDREDRQTTQITNVSPDFVEY
jgi:hypothetical protein